MPREGHKHSECGPASLGWQFISFLCDLIVVSPLSQFPCFFHIHLQPPSLFQQDSIFIEGQNQDLFASDNSPQVFSKCLSFFQVLSNTQAIRVLCPVGWGYKTKEVLEDLKPKKIWEVLLMRTMMAIIIMMVRLNSGSELCFIIIINYQAHKLNVQNININVAFLILILV